MIAELDLPVRDPWFQRQKLADGVTRITEPAVHPFLRSNIWHVAGADRDLLVDTGMGVASLRQAFPDLFRREPIVFVTHGHYDHTGGAHEFSEVHTHQAEAAAISEPEEATLFTEQLSASFAAALADDEPSGVAPHCLLSAVPEEDYSLWSYATTPSHPRELADGDQLDLGDRCFTVLHLPGHTPGSAGLFDSISGLLFTGDVLYDGELLDELPESNIADYVQSIMRLASVNPRVVHPGHEDSFGPERMRELAGAYLSSRSTTEEA
jgi:glyoxylase-like metal-dependent hydrolase (beta-lactamase superfamily II)